MKTMSSKKCMFVHLFHTPFSGMRAEQPYFQNGKGNAILYYVSEKGGEDNENITKRSQSDSGI